MAHDDGGALLPRQPAQEVIQVGVVVDAVDLVVRPGMRSKPSSSASRSSSNVTRPPLVDQLLHLSN